MKRPNIYIALLTLLVNTLPLFSQSSSLIDEAWKAWEINDNSTVEQKFLSAIKADPKNSRAYIGLAYFYELQHRDKEAWAVFRNILNSEPDATPYFYSSWYTSKISTNQYDITSGVIDVFEKYAQKADQTGVLKAMSHEVLGNLYQRKGQLERSKKHFEAISSLDQWAIIGPFENISASGFNAVYPPETEFSMSAEYVGKNNVPAKWFIPPSIKFDKWLDFQAYFGDRQTFLYANTFVYSPKKQTVHVRVGTSGALKTFLNDVEIIRDSLETNNDFDTYIVETELQEGWNRLLVKVGYSEIERCNFLARITDQNGEPVPGLKSRNSAQSYSKVTPSFIKHVPLFAKEFFKDKIEKNPTHIENYLMLADCFLRNDQAIEAELLLRKAQKLSPNCGIIYKYFLEAYNRGRKRDELITTYEKMVALNKDLIDALLYKFAQHLENEDFDKAEEILLKIEKQLPESEISYASRLDLYSKKRLTEKVIQLAKDGYAKFPTNWKYVNLACVIDYQATRKQDGTIEIIKKYLQSDYNETGLSNLAKAYLEASKLEDWEKTYKKMLEYAPSSPGYHYQMASVFNSMQKYDRAAESAEKALTFCPSCGLYWSKLGDIKRSSKKIDEAKNSYASALQYVPTDYDSRDILRELDGKKSIFTVFGETNLDSVIKASPTASQHPEASSSIVLCKTNRVVYPQGASETSEELLIRVFNDKGIDRFKEYYVGYNSYSQNLIIEKAVTIKTDGSEIRGDVDKGHIVFKSLEKNDFIYIKWHIRNFNSGKLAKHFWDEFYFNRYFPVKEAKYSLLVPKGMDFTFQGQNLTIEPKTTTISEGQLFEWKMENLEQIAYEADMPNLDEIGKMLRISSIPDWNYLVNWYAELAQTKAQTTYEIKEKVQELLPNPGSISDAEKIKTIYDYITENIRYSSVSFRQSGLIPQKARDVLVNKIGDCKDVSTLGIAMLREVGIKANYVLVNSGDEERRGNIPPSIDFNHCIVAVENGTSTPTFLDLTANNHPVGSIPSMDRDAFSLVIKPGNSSTITLPRVQSVAPNMISTTFVSLDENNKATVTCATDYSGVLTAGLRARYRNKSQSDREKLMLSELSSEYPSVKLTTFEISDLENLAPRVQFAYSCEIPNYLTEAGDFKLLKLPWRDDLRADDAFGYEKRMYALKFRSSVDTSYEQMQITLPAGYEPLDVPKPKLLTSSIADYSITYSFVDSVLKAKRTFIHKKSFIEPNEYEEFKKFYNAAVKEDAKQILIRQK
ncbi:MAG: DUF3857 domain-containing protein [Ignavibacteria bacterium]|nr:DUF3857 domain-containing protein [Ignavibacteria bacterium]